MKLYYEILDDPKMGKLPDRLFRRTIELFLLAGEKEGDGLLPSVEDMAWRLRTTEEELAETLHALFDIGIVHETSGGWIVTNLAKRQSPMTSTERVQRFRKQTGNADETIRFTNETDKIRVDKDKSRKDKDTAAAFSEYQANTGLREAEALLLHASEFAALPPAFIEYMDIVEGMIRKYGEEDTRVALMKSRGEWERTRRKDGKFYSVLNPAWVGWALAYLAGDTPWEKGKSQSEYNLEKTQKLLARMDEQKKNALPPAEISRRIGEFRKPKALGDVLKGQTK